MTYTYISKLSFPIFSIGREGFQRHVVLSSLENVIVYFLAELKVLRKWKMEKIGGDHRESNVGAIRHEIGKTDIDIMLCWSLDFQVVKDVWRARIMIAFTFCTF